MSLDVIEDLTPGLVTLSLKTRKRAVITWTEREVSLTLCLSPVQAAPDEQCVKEVSPACAHRKQIPPYRACWKIMNPDNENIICILVLEPESWKEGQCCLCSTVTILFFLDGKNSRTALLSVKIRRQRAWCMRAKLITASTSLRSVFSSSCINLLGTILHVTLRSMNGC